MALLRLPDEMLEVIAAPRPAFVRSLQRSPARPLLAPAPVSDASLRFAACGFPG